MVESGRLKKKSTFMTEHGASTATMAQDNPEIDFCTLGMFIIGKSIYGERLPRQSTSKGMH
jgi:hypothetical protein